MTIGPPTVPPHASVPELRTAAHVVADAADFRRVAIVVPCYNEAGRLDVERFARCLTAMSVDFVFVDDGSTDGTRSVLESFQARYPDRIDVVGYDRNHGKAEAVRRGMLAAFGRNVRYAGYWDADLATPLDAIEDFLAVLDARADCDILIGARVQLLGTDIVRHPTRHYLGRMFATAASVTLSLPVYDTQCGAKVFRITPQIAELFSTPFLSRWVFDVELIARHRHAMRGQHRIVELPLRRWHDVKGSKVKPQHFVVALADIARIWLRYRT